MTIAAAGPRLHRRRAMIAAAVAVMAAMPFLLPNDVSRSRVFGYFESRTSEALSPPAAWAARWVVQAQPWFYPLNEAIRETLLLGYGFGYDPQARDAGE